MGRRPPSATSLQDYARFASERIRAARVAKPVLGSLDPLARVSIPSTSTPHGEGRAMEGDGRQDGRVPLSEVVADCVKRWFLDTLKEAKNGDSTMQVLVGQMYQSGYGVPRNEQKARAWMTKASKHRSSVWKVSDKHPGYNASDSDSDDMKDGTKS